MVLRSAFQMPDHRKPCNGRWHYAAAAQCDFSIQTFSVESRSVAHQIFRTEFAVAPLRRLLYIVTWVTDCIKNEIKNYSFDCGIAEHSQYANVSHSWSISA